MIDLDKYYIAKKYAGPSGAYPAVGGFVPPATSGDSSKFLRGDGSWAEVNIPSGVFPTVMSGAASGADGQAGLVPKPVAGDNRYFLRGDGTWSDPTISRIQYIETGTDILLDVSKYDTFVVNIIDPITFSYSGFDAGKSINIHLVSYHTGHMPHIFPTNTIFAELGDANIIYSFEGFTTRILLQNAGSFIINFSSVVKNYPTGYPPYYYGAYSNETNSIDTFSIGLDLIDEFLNNILNELIDI